MINVLVTGAGGGVGQGVIKSLKMISDMDIKVIAADMSELAAGLYVSDVAHLVDICSSDNYLKSLAKIFIEESVDFYIPGTDVELEFCATNKQLILDQFNVHTIISSLEVIQISDNKFKTFSFLKANNFNYPETEYLSDVDFKLIEYPVIIKPSVGSNSKGVFKVKNYDELEPHLKNTKNIVMQECIGDSTNEYTCTVVKVKDKLSPVLALKRVLRSGDTYKAEPIKSAKIEKYVLDVASKLDIDGGCNFQLLLDKNGEPKIFEINSRFSGTTPFCSQIGFNPVEFYLKRYMGIKTKIDIKYNSIILRYWAEIVVEADQVTQLALTSKVKPSISNQFKIFS